MIRSLFSLGRMVATPGALDALVDSEQHPLPFLLRHACGDWGVVCEDDCEANRDALRDGARIFSAYLTAKGVKIWVITEADRSSTTVLLPSEY
jgi:hypothetical protein